MANSKISALTDGTTPADTDAFPVSRSGGTTQKLTWSQIRNAIVPLHTEVNASTWGTSVKYASLTKNENLGNQGPLLSGRITLVYMPMRAGASISTITFISGSTALSAGTNQVFGLYDTSWNRLATTADDTSTAWAANSAKTLTLTGAPYSVPATAGYYVACLVVASTVPSLACGPAISYLRDTAPFMSGNSNTGQTSLPSTCTALSAGLANDPVCYVS